MKSSFIAALLALAVAVPGLAQPSAAHATYRDDPIVRDLKAGKLTVREARLLQEQRAARQQQAVSRERQQQAKQKKAKAPIKKLTTTHAGKKSKPVKLKVAGSKRADKHGTKHGNKHGNKQGNQHARTSGSSPRKVTHPVSTHHKAAVRKKRAPMH